MSEGPEPKPRERNWDAYAAVIASFIGLLALLVAGYTAYLQRQQVRAQVWPKLEVSLSHGHIILVTNNGVGPARVKAARVTVDGRPVKKWSDVMLAFGHEPYGGHSTLHGRTMPAGEKIEAFEVPDDEKGRRAFEDVFVKNLTRIDMVVCYCSVLDQCWLGGGEKVEGSDMDPEIGECPIARADRFTQ